MAFDMQQVGAHAVTWIVLIATFIFNGLASAPAAPFTQQTGKISDKFKLQVTPAGATFAIWGVIYAWQVAWLLYAASGVWRQKTLATIPMLILFSCANLSNIFWLISWDREVLWLSPILLLLTPVFLWSCSVLAYRQFVALRESFGKADWWLYQVLITNGLGWYATWTSLAACLNVGIALAYNSKVDQDAVAIIVLVLWTLVLLVYDVFDAYFCLKRDVTDLTLSPYIVVVIGVLGSYGQNSGLDRASSVYSLVLLIVAVIYLLIKFAGNVYFVVKRHSN